MDGRRTMLMAAAAACLSCMLQTKAALADGPGSEGTMTRIRVIIGDAILPATLDNTAAGRDFAAMLPLDLTLTDYHGIEKVSDLPRKLDTSGAPGSYRPQTGDITLYAPWGNLAIFYRPFQESRGLVRLGTFDGPIDALIEHQSFLVRIELAE